MVSSIQSKLLEFICRNYMVEESEINLEKSLVDQGIIDSFGLIEISSFIQKAFEFSVSQDEMNRANFGSVVKLVSFIERKKMP
jgi:acyl carrier protein